MEREREREMHKLRRPRCTSSKDGNLCGGLWVWIWVGCAGDDNGEDTVLHICDDLLDLCSLLGKTGGGGKERRRTVVSFGTAMVR